MTSLVDAESVLAIDIGSLNTRALLFDVVDGLYHFVSAGTGPTTASAPFYNISEGVHIALTRLEEITGRKLLNNEANLILPSQNDGSGVDRLALTSSAGEDLSLLTMGLLSDVSLHSAQRLAATTYGRMVESIGLTDHRRLDAQLDAIVRASPDIVILAGGTEKGATRSVAKLAELLATACRLMPQEKRPKVLYCGNQALKKKVVETLERETRVDSTHNIRPGIDTEDLAPAELTLANMTAKMRIQQLDGLSSLSSISSAPLLPSAFAFGRMMRFSSELSEISKATLGVDLGSRAVTLAVASEGNLSLNVLRNLGMGHGLQSSLAQMRLEDVAQWLPVDIPAGDVRDHLYQKSLFPASLPMTQETLYIEQAAARQILRLAVRQMLERNPIPHLAFERIFISGATLAQAPLPSQSLLMVLDGIQPVGISVCMLDPYGLSQSLGAIAGINSLLPAQIIDSGAYINLATIICPVSGARNGTKILTLKITYEDGNTTSVDVKQGSLVSLPVMNGQVAHIDIDARFGTVIDPTLPRLKRFKVTGGQCGVVVDARGRPLHLPADPAGRRDLVARWTNALEQRHVVDRQ